MDKVAKTIFQAHIYRGKFRLYDKTGSVLLIEIKDGKSYGELPLATALDLNKAKAAHPLILLVSLSDISEILGITFNQLGIPYLIKPTVENVSRKVVELTATVTAK